MNLEEKQEKFEYRSPKDLVVVGEPFSPKEWNEKLTKIGGRCPLGDPRLRIVWGGTAKKRGYIQTQAKSEEAMVVKYPAPVPHTRTIVGYTYFDGKQNVRVVRADQIPKGRLGYPIIETHSLGQLRWMLERKFTPEELIAMQMYPDPNSPMAKTFGVRGGRRYVAAMDPRGEYIGLFPIQTPDGKYWEPDDAWFEMLAKTQKEVHETSYGERMVMLNEAMDAIELREQKAREAKADLEETIFEETLIEVEKAPVGRVMVDQHIKAA